MNITKNLLNSINERLLETKNPCKSFRTEELAIKAGEEIAEVCGKMFDSRENSARYIVLFVPKMNRWIAAIDITELLSRSSSIGGYIMYPASKGFYTF